MHDLSPRQVYWSHVKENKYSYILGTLALLLTSWTEVMLPKFIEWTFNLLQSPGQRQGWLAELNPSLSAPEALNQLVLGLLFTLLLAWIGRIGWRQILAKQTHIAGHNLKVRFWQSLRHQSLQELAKLSLGDLMSRATADWNKTRFIHGFTLVLTFDLIFFSALAILSMLMIHIPLTLLCLAIVPFLPKPILTIARQEADLHKKAQEQLSLLTECITQSLKTIRLQRATASELSWQQKLNQLASVYAEKQLAVLFKSWKIFILGALPTLFAYLILLSYGLYCVKTQQISLGSFIAMQSYILLLQSPLFELGSMIGEWQTGFSSFQRLVEIFRLEKKPSQTPETIISHCYDPELPLSLHQLSFRYPSGKVILSQLNLQIRTGEKLGIFGPVGAGKSTLLHLISGLLPTAKGHIFLSGLDMTECEGDWIVQNLAIVPQSPFLFSGTIRYNLDPSSQLEDQQLLAALHLVCLTEDWPDDQPILEVWISESGQNLSGGQKQRLALARALLKNASLLIIDDGLSAVDSITERKILSRLESALQGQSLLWLSHRRSSLSFCHRVFALEAGSLTAFDPSHTWPDSPQLPPNPQSPQAGRSYAEP